MKAGNQPPPPPVAVALEAQADPTLDWLTKLVISMVEVLLVRLGNPQWPLPPPRVSVWDSVSVSSLIILFVR